jgi:hypothetical protein
MKSLKIPKDDVVFTRKQHSHLDFETLKNEGTIIELFDDVFYAPVITRFGLKSFPSVHDIVKAIAENEGSIIEVHGGAALNLLGLSTQVPVNIIYYTSGPSHFFYLNDKLPIKMEHIDPFKLRLAGRPAGLALIALYHLGFENVTDETLAIIASKLSSDEFNVLCNAITLRNFHDSK